MNNWIQQIQNLLGSGSNQQGDNHQGGSRANLGDMFKPAALGGLAGVLLSNKSARKIVGSLGKNALIIGGGAAVGAVLWNQYKKRVRDTHQDDPQFGVRSSSENVRARRLVQALVFAAKSDGHIDDSEKQRIDENIQQLQLGNEPQRWVQEAIDQPLDPELLAKDVKNEEEALEIYLLSCAVIDADHFMEKSYLDALATTLKIPQDVRESIATEVNKAK